MSRLQPSRSGQPMSMHVSKYRPSAWFRFWHAGSAREWLVRGRTIDWVGGNSPESVALLDLSEEPEVRQGLLWSYVLVRARSGERRSPGLTASDATEAVQQISLRRLALSAELAAEIHPQVRSLLNEWDGRVGSHRWMRASSVSAWSPRAAAVASRLPESAVVELLEAEVRDDVARLRDLVANTEARRLATNSAHESWALAHYASFFDTVESQPLTRQQRLACIRDEDNNLVLASAGSGKTSVITARAAHLVSSGLASPGEILVLAFNADAAREIRERLAARGTGLTGVKVHTFHAYGQGLLTRGRVQKPSVSRLAEQDAELPVFVLGQLQRVASAPGSPAGDPDLREFLARYLAPPEQIPSDASSWDPGAATVAGTTLEQATRKAALHGAPLATADGRYRVKSQQELTIANFLFMNQVDYSYEAPYEFATADVDRRQYKPDFYIPGYGIYLEHFAVSSPEHPAPTWMDKDAYLAKVSWARGLHARSGTHLIETCSADAWGADGLAGELERRLLAEGVQLRPRPLAPLFADVDVSESRDPRVMLVRLIARFITTAKTSMLSDAELTAAAAQQGARSATFLRLALKVRDAYEAELSAAGEIDFTDMILGAAGRVHAGEVRPSFRHILVDEFQDLSAARASLLLALRNASAGSSLFCVGDDWQSIYGFTGSDVSWISEFSSRFGPTATTALDRTFRFDQRQADLSRDFVTRNPGQMPKPVHALRRGTPDSVRVVFTEGGVLASKSAIETRTMELIAGQIAVRGGPESALVLTRYSPSADDRATMDALKRAAPQLRWEISTVHRAKGREADHVFVVGLSGGVMGFPNLMEDDPVLRLVLPSVEPFPNAEERRLFYVAMTRARRGVWLVTPRSNPSAFVNELLKEDPDIVTLVAMDGQLTLELDPPHRCPRCTHGTIVTRTGPYGEFLACSAWPSCEARFVVCPKCQEHPFLPDPSSRSRFACTGSRCTHSASACPTCSRMDLPRWTGFMVEKNGRYGTFHGCRNWRREGGCTQTSRAA